VTRTLCVSLRGKLRLTEPSQADETRPAFGGRPAVDCGPVPRLAATALRAVRAKNIRIEELNVALADAEAREHWRLAAWLRERLREMTKAKR
jgi:hypothetical protein